MGEIGFSFAQQPQNKDTVVKALQGLADINKKVIEGDFSSFKDASSSGDGKASVAGLVSLLDQSLADLKQNHPAEAKASIQKFRESWLEIEGVVLTQSSKIYTDAERDMVSSYAMLSSNPPDTAGAERTIRSMRTIWPL